MTVDLQSVFQFCPHCGNASHVSGMRPFQCDSCQFTFFFGPSSAVAGIITSATGKVLLLRRQRDPGKGKLGLPGGFVDVGESAEEALEREVREEINLRVERSEYLASFPNTYSYRDVTYAVTDVFFVCHVTGFAQLSPQASEVAAHHFCYPTETELDQMAFHSNRMALERFLKLQPTNRHEQ